MDTSSSDSSTTSNQSQPVSSTMPSQKNPANAQNLTANNDQSDSAVISSASEKTDSIPYGHVSSKYPSESVTEQSPPTIPFLSSNQRPNMILLSLAVVFVGVLAGVSLYTFGIFRGNILRMGESVSNQPTKIAAQNIKKITIGTDATYPPMEFKDETGNLVGYDMDLANEIAKEMNINVEVKDIPFDKVFEALDSNQIDAIISSVTITNERKEKYSFSEPYINAGQVMLTLRTTQGIQWTTADLAGKRIGVQNGTTSEEEALRYVEKNLVTSFADYPLAVTALNAKQIDVVIVDLTAAKGIVDENPNLQIVSDPFTNEYYGIVFRKDNSFLKSGVDKAILSLQKRGILNNIKQKWFQ